MLASLLVALSIVSSPVDALPGDAAQALQDSKSAVLYSLEPWARPSVGAPTLHGFKVLGKARISGAAYTSAAEEFKLALKSGEDAAACFDPRHAIRIVSRGHQFEFLLCYACHQLAVYRDGKHLASLSAAGSAKVLNALLVAAKVPLSTSYNEDAELARAKLSQAAAQRWKEAMPRSLAASPDGQSPFVDDAAITKMARALADEYPNSEKRILALFAWYGAGAGPWSGFPSYESIAEQLLLKHSTEELLAALNSAELSEAHVEGAARLFGGWVFSHERPGELRFLPAELKSRLLIHSQRSDDTDKVDRAKYAFGPTKKKSH